MASVPRPAFEVVLADPPWSFDNKKTGGSMSSGAGQQYDTMSVADLETVGAPLRAVTHRNSCLFLWVPTALKYSHAPRVAHAWGYPDYVTTIYWDKTGGKLGMGFWFRNVIEELLLFTRGDVPPFRCQLPNRIGLPSLGHSRKPDEFHRLIEKATGRVASARCLELFARRTMAGWTTAGYELTGQDIRLDLRALAAGVALDAQIELTARLKSATVGSLGAGDSEAASR